MSGLDFQNSRLGILGGGQLGKMLLQKASDFNLHTSVLDPDPAAPCRHLTHHFQTGSFADYNTVYAFGKTCDVLTIEIEHVNIEALEQLEKEGVQVYPQPRVIRTVQDKGLQKIFYRTHRIDTAEFLLAENRESVLQHKSFLPFVQKLRKGGYDGRGVKIIPSEKQLPGAFDQPSVLEKLVPVAKELSVIAARNCSGDINVYPPVEMQFNQQANLVEFLSSPAEIEAEISGRAREMAFHLIQNLEMVGLLAVEMFLTESGQLLVNEMAPRPHNSGHQTIEGNVTSQYEQHLRAIFNFPLGATEIIRPSVMINLLGQENHNGPACYEGLDKVLEIPGAYVHLYGKSETRPFRKMGHVTVLGDTLAEAKQKAILVKDALKVISSNTVYHD